MFHSTPRRLQVWTALAALALVASGGGCGPFGYLKKVAKEANNAVAEAEASGAQQYAPYEYWGAVSYLEQAKILMAYSEYERSFDYGTRAKQLAEEAKRKAERRESGKTKESLDGPLDDRSAPAGTGGTAPAPKPAAAGSGASGKAGGSVKVGGGT